LNRVNSHVERLHRYLPFNPAHDLIYEEYQRSEDGLNLKTKALDYLKDLGKQNTAKLVVLTGDAGHGKTHLCRRLLEDYLGYDEDQARELINDKCDATEVINPSPGNETSRPLLVHKDFSELEVTAAVDLIESTLPGDDTLTVICANEGRLRAVLDSRTAGEGCRQVLVEFNSSFTNGLCSSDGTIHIVNLNFQSVAASDGISLLGGTLHYWLLGNRWRVCRECDASKQCPIFHNRNLLDVQNDTLAERRRERTEILFATLERLGVVVTIREMLMAVAYFLTAGLSCKDVHARSSKDGWQHEYAYYNLLFAPPKGITRDKLSRIPIMLELPRLDPGMRGSRVVDERLINEQDVFRDGEMDLQFTNNVFAQPPIIDASHGVDDVIGNPSSNRERKKEIAFIEKIVRSLRRRAFFDEDEIHGSPLDRLGFDNARDFQAICDGGLPLQQMARLKNRLISGLHTIQGLQMSHVETNLHLVDPAFGNATSHAAIISRKIQSRSIKLLSMSAALAFEGQDENTILRSVDWTDRYVVARFTVDEVDHDLKIDLTAFDCLSRAGGGYVAEEFYAHDLKRTKNFLGHLAEMRTSDGGEINLFLDGSVHSVSIDEGMLQVGGSL